MIEDTKNDSSSEPEIEEVIRPATKRNESVEKIKKTSIKTK
jgi:hypothetical protein